MSTLAPTPSAPAVARRPAIRPAVARLIRGHADDAAWVRPAFIGVMALAAILYLWNLTVSGYANSYYAMAAQAASQRWSAWFFGSLDAANFITVDKPPLATMLLGLSVRLLGLSSWSILLPQALLGVATVGLLFVIVRRSFGPAAATIAAIVAALTPAAVLIFRFDNPDALLTFLFVAAAWAVQRAIVDGRTRWLVAAGIFVGLAFNTKFLQAYLVVPALGFAYLIAGAPAWRRRFGQLIVFGIVSLAASAWWVAAVELIPASARPYIGGSDTNSALELLFGYDGLGRIFGLGGPGPGGGGGGFGSDPGLFRMFNEQFAGQVGWLLPLALAGLAIGLWARRREPRTDLARAAYLLWGGWLLVHVLVFSFMSGIIHSYYTVAMAPAIGALVGGGLVELWRLRSAHRFGGVPLAAAVIGTAALAFVILERTPAFAPGLGLAALGIAAVAGMLLALPPLRRMARISVVLAGAAMLAMLLGPAAYAADTMQTAYSGGDPAAGPAAGGQFGPGGDGGRVDGGAAGSFPAPRSGAQPPGTAPGRAPDGTDAGAGTDGGERFAVDQALVEYLVANRGGTTWLVAVNGSSQAAAIQLATGVPVMAMGGFSGGDPAPSVERLATLVSSGQLRFVIVGGGGFGGGIPGGGAPGGFGGDTGVSSWVTANCAAVERVGNGSLYDCATT